MTHDRRTGLNSYVLLAQSGEYIYDPRWPLGTGYDRDAAQLWLWEPEKLDAEVATAQKRMPWAGRLTAVRAR
jgi:hypothetical protein